MNAKAKNAKLADSETKQLALIFVIFMLSFDVNASSYIPFSIPFYPDYLENETGIVTAATNVGAGAGVAIGLIIGLPVSFITSPLYIVAGERDPFVPIYFMTVVFSSYAGAAITGTPFWAVSKVVDIFRLSYSCDTSSSSCAPQKTTSGK